MSTLTTLGNKSKTTILNSESHKLSLEFEAAEAIKKGQPVKLNAAGKVAVWAKADGRDLLVGYAYSDAALGDNVTVFTRGFMVIFAASAGAFSCGPVIYNGYSTTTINDTSGYSTYDDNPGTGETNNGWALDAATGANQLVRILLMN